MRNPERIDEILELISDIWHKHPDLRLGQLIGNCLSIDYNYIDGIVEVDLYYIEDDKLQDILIEKYYGNTTDKS